MGYQAGNDLTSGNSNTALGGDALSAVTTGSYNTAVGKGASSQSPVNVLRTTSLGYQAAYYGGSRSTSVGDLAGIYQTGEYNTFLGASAGVGSNTYRVSEGVASTRNVGVGQSSLYALAGGGYNTAIGRYTGRAITTGSYNVLLGNAAGEAMTTGIKNVVLGAGAGQNITTGSNNIFIEMTAAANFNGNNVTIIGSFDGNTTSSPNVNAAAYAGAVVISSNDPNNSTPLLFMEKR